MRDIITRDITTRDCRDATLFTLFVVFSLICPPIGLSFGLWWALPPKR